MQKINRDAAFDSVSCLALRNTHCMLGSETLPEIAHLENILGYDRSMSLLDDLLADGGTHMLVVRREARMITISAPLPGIECRARLTQK